MANNTQNLQKVLNDKKISCEACAAVLGISPKSAWNKVHGRTQFTVAEALKLKKELLPEYDLDFLFGQE